MGGPKTSMVKFIKKILKSELDELVNEKVILKRLSMLVLVIAIISIVLSCIVKDMEPIAMFYNNTNIFIASFTVVGMFISNIFLLKINLKQKKASFVQQDMSYMLAQNLKVSIGFIFMYHIVLLSVKIFSIQNKFIIVLGVLLYLSAFIFLYFAVNDTIDSFNKKESDMNSFK